MPLTSQDFQDLNVQVQDLARAMRENTDALRKAQAAGGTGGGGLVANAAGVTPGAGGGLGAAAIGGNGDPAANAPGAGFSLSTVTRAMTATPVPGMGALGSLAAGAAGGPVGLGLAAVGLVGQGIGMLEHRVAQQDQDHIAAAAAGLSVIGNPGRLTSGQASLEAHFKTQHAFAETFQREETEKAFHPGALDFEGSQAHFEKARHSAEVEASTRRRQEDVLDPERRARDRTDRKLENLLRFGDLEHNEAQAHAYERLYRLHLKQEDRFQHNERFAEKLIDRVTATRNGVQGFGMGK